MFKNIFDMEFSNFIGYSIDICWSWPTLLYLVFTFMFMKNLGKVTLIDNIIFRNSFNIVLGLI
jgi:hypothetical protein